MNIKINDKSKTEKEIQVTIPSDKVNKYKDKAAQVLSLESTIDGFRPGKAPKEIIEEKFGKERLWKESCYEALKSTYPEIIKENNYFVVSPPKIEIQSMDLDKDFSYKITVEILPEIELPDYKKISKELLKNKKKIEVSEKEVEKTLETIQKSRAKSKAVDRPSQKGDELLINFQGSIDGVNQEGLKADKMPFILGEQKFIEGFEDNLLNLKQNDSREFSIKMNLPDNPKESKNIDFKVDVISVKEREIPQLNDDFAKSLGDFSDLNNLKQKIKENILIEKEHKEKEATRVKIIEAISNEMNLEIPQEMINRELDGMFDDFKQQLSQSGLSLDGYLNKINKKEQDIRNDWQDKAKKRITMSLILSQIAAKEKIVIEKQEIEKETNNYLSQFKDVDKMPETDKLKDYIENIIRNEKVFKLLES